MYQPRRLPEGHGAITISLNDGECLHVGEQQFIYAVRWKNGVRISIIGPKSIKVSRTNTYGKFQESRAEYLTFFREGA